MSICPPFAADFETDTCQMGIIKPYFKNINLLFLTVDLETEACEIGIIKYEFKHIFKGNVNLSYFTAALETEACEIGIIKYEFKHTFKRNINLIYFTADLETEACEMGICMNGATCIRNEETVECDCMLPYYGSRCQYCKDNSASRIVYECHSYLYSICVAFDMGYVFKDV